jgi:holin-like protein
LQENVRLTDSQPRSGLLAGMALLVGFQLLGELVMRALHLPVPAAVIGMFFLFLFLLALKRVPRGLQIASNGLLENLALLFVPAGAAAFLDIGSISSELLAIGLAVVISTWLAMGISAGSFLWLERLREHRS